ncbi:hypothetical protein UFOVP56_51 [uncultured Caudovirales phage]|uniref:Uncharacterized protein n=1 Tax=uncultured Caudovirales phage TaxID=2100421 RepID=A0A6J5T8L5_9CAUD|nr:hypothetical protein UFOVP56_51 [uncultured Caudovirales phage]
MTHPELPDALRQIAERYFNGMYVNVRSGICLALCECYGVVDPYKQMGRVMKELGFENDYLTRWTTARADWEPRAWMCLILAEYLENK